MSSRYTRQASPPDRRIIPAGVIPAGVIPAGTIPYAANDPYYSRNARDSHQAPRSSVERVIPLSTQTYVTSTRTPDTYADSRRSSAAVVTDVPQRRSSVLGTSSTASRARSILISNSDDRPPSPVTRTAKYKYDTDYYVTPSSSSGSSKTQHKKVYSIDDERGSRLVNDNGNRGGRAYHLNGPSSKSSRVDEYGGYEYTDARGMYSTTEPRTRTRRGSVEAPHERWRDAAPPPATRGLDKINSGVTRHGSLRDTPRSPQYYMENNRGSYSEDDGLQARLMPTSQNPLVYERTARGDSPPMETDTRRRNPKYEDTNVVSRGFGIRSGVASSVAGESYLRESGSSNVPQLLDVGAIAAPYPRTSDLDLRGNYAGEPGVYGDEHSRSEASRSDRSRRDHDARDRDGPDRSRDYTRERDRDGVRDSHTDGRRPRDRDYDDDMRPRHRDQRERDRDRYDEDDRKSKRSDRDDHRDRRDRDRDDRKARGEDENHLTPEVLTALAGGAAALGAGGLLASRERDRQRENATNRDDREKRDRQREPRDRDLERDDRDRPRGLPEVDDRDKRERPRELPVAEDRDKRDRPRDAQPPAPVPVPISVPAADDRERRDRPRDTQSQFQVPVSDDRERRDRPKEPAMGVSEERDRKDRPRDSPVAIADERERRDRPREPQETDGRGKLERRTSSPGESAPRERHYVTKDDRRDVRNEEASPPLVLDPDEEYRRRIELEKERFRQPKPDDMSREPPSVNESRRRRVDDRGLRELQEGRSARDEDVRGMGEPGNGAEPPVESQALARYGESGLIQEPSDNMDGPRESRVRIVEPPKDKDGQKDKEIPRGILRRPTDKFPEDPNPIREGVAPLKDATKKGVPPGARWTKIDRRLVNPEALEEAKERFEERQDCVIVLRVLTKEEIQKFAERTAEIREKHDRRRRRDKEREHDGLDDESDEEDDGPRKITWDK